MAVGVYVWYNGDECSNDFLPLLMLMRINKVLPVIFPLCFCYCEASDFCFYYVLLLQYSIDVVRTLSYLLVYTKGEPYIFFKTTWTYWCLINGRHFGVSFCGFMLLVETLSIINSIIPLYRPGCPNKNNSVLVQIMALSWIDDNL